ncbi:MAG: hypothetical protein LUG16_01425 [Candidatus Gastranaerophilales bacterium]|nr:hypothetical protein [Candidatus Gastranaerophilales bacterium]
MTGVSFGSNYRLYLKGNEDFSNENNLKTQVFNNKTSPDYVEKLNKHNSPGYSIAYYSIPNQDDNLLETYCANRGIEFKKTKDNYCSDKEILTARVKPSQNQGKYIFTTINAEKLNELLAETLDEDSSGNAKDILENSDKYKTNSFLGNSYMIPAPVIILKAEDDSIKGASFAENPETYFSLKEQGIQDIPVLIDDDTQEICEKYGLLCE